MRRFKRAVRTLNAATGQAALEIIAGAVGCRLIGLSLTLTSIGATVFGLGRPAVKGNGPLNLAPLICEDDGSTSLTMTSTAAGASASSPTQFFNRVSTTGGLGYASDQLIPSTGIWIPFGSTFVLFNILATPGVTADVNVEILEKS